MRFIKKRISNLPPQTQANRTMNKILTYGLIFFILYAVYNNKYGQNGLVTPVAPLAKLNYTPFDYSDYAFVQNLLSGDTTAYKLKNGKYLELELSNEDVEAIKANKTGPLPIYRIEVEKANYWKGAN